MNAIVLITVLLLAISNAEQDIISAKRFLRVANQFDHHVLIENTESQVIHCFQSLITTLRSWFPFCFVNMAKDVDPERQEESIIQEDRPRVDSEVVDTPVVEDIETLAENRDEIRLPVEQYRSKVESSCETDNSEENIAIRQTLYDSSDSSLDRITKRIANLKIASDASDSSIEKLTKKIANLKIAYDSSHSSIEKLTKKMASLSLSS